MMIINQCTFIVVLWLSIFRSTESCFLENVSILKYFISLFTQIKLLVEAFQVKLFCLCYNTFISWILWSQVWVPITFYIILYTFLKGHLICYLLGNYLLSFTGHKLFASMFGNEGVIFSHLSIFFSFQLSK